MFFAKRLFPNNDGCESDQNLRFFAPGVFLSSAHPTKKCDTIVFSSDITCRKFFGHIVVIISFRPLSINYDGFV